MIKHPKNANLFLSLLLLNMSANPATAESLKSQKTSSNELFLKCETTHQYQSMNLKTGERDPLKFTKLIRTISINENRAVMTNKTEGPISHHRVTVSAEFYHFSEISDRKSSSPDPLISYVFYIERGTGKFFSNYKLEGSGGWIMNADETGYCVRDNPKQLF